MSKFSFWHSFVYAVLLFFGNTVFATSCPTYTGEAASKAISITFTLTNGLEGVLCGVKEINDSLANIAVTWNHINNLCTDKNLNCNSYKDNNDGCNGWNFVVDPNSYNDFPDDHKSGEAISRFTISRFKSETIKLVNQCRDSLINAQGNINAPKTLSQANVSNTNFESSACEKAQEEADDCCEDPLKCAFGISGGEFVNPLMIDQILKSAGYSMNAGDIRKSCEVNKNINMIMGTMNAFIYAKCIAKVNDCKSVCEDDIDNFRKMLEDGCNEILKANDNSVPQKLKECKDKHDAFIAAKEKRDACKDGTGNTAGQYAQQATLNLLQMIGGEDCKKLAENPFNLPEIPGAPNCALPENSSNPLCAPDCTLPGAAENNILCRGFNSATPGIMTKLGTPIVDGGGNSVANLGIIGETGQDAPFADIDPKRAESKGIGNGGGGGLPGSSGGDGGSPFANSSAGSGGGGSGLNTNIANPMARAGYRVSAAGTPSSDGGYSSPVARGNQNDQDKTLSLNSLKGAQRSIAGLGSARIQKDISKAHEDIFKKVTNAFFRQCETNTYEECENVVHVNAQPKPGG